MKFTTELAVSIINLEPLTYNRLINHQKNRWLKHQFFSIFGILIIDSRSCKIEKSEKPKSEQKRFCRFFFPISVDCSLIGFWFE